MGVKGLYSLLEDYRHIYQDVRFRDSKLVVDGSSLVHLLYKMADQNPGGEYLAFQAEVQAFFKNLSDLGIKPYVVMDGGSATNNIKLDPSRTGSKRRFGVLPWINKY